MVMGQRVRDLKGWRSQRRWSVGLLIVVEEVDGDERSKRLTFGGTKEMRRLAVTRKEGR